MISFMAAPPIRMFAAIIDQNVKKDSRNEATAGCICATAWERGAKMSTESQLERILEAKNAQGLTNQQFADLVGINKSTVYRIFGGKVTPDSKTIDLMEQALGISDTPSVELEIIDPKQSDTIRNLLKIQDRWVAQLGAYYNRSLAEKDRVILRERISKIVLFVLLMLMVGFVILSTSYDAAHPDIRWIRQQLGM